MSDTLLHVIQCYDDKCRSHKKSFIESIQYHQLKTEKHYQELADKVRGKDIVPCLAEWDKVIFS